MRTAVVPSLRVVNILVLCTGNICRSPMAEVLLAREIDERGAHAEVLSAGFVTQDRAAEPYAVGAMAERGIDLADHRSRLVTPGLLDRSNLIIGMARRHVREAHTVQRGVLPRTYTLKELVRRGAEFGSAGRDLEGWLGPIDQERDPADLLGDDEIDDVADPMGRPLRVFRSCANEIEANIIALADLLWPRDGP